MLAVWCRCANCELSQRPGPSLCRLDAGDLQFKAAELGVIVVAQPPGQVDEGIWSKLQRADAVGQVPTDSGETCSLSHAKADVLFLHEHGRSLDADFPSDKDGFFVAHAERLKAAEPGEQRRRDLFEGQLGITFE